MMVAKKKMIKVSEEIHHRLSKHGNHVGETFEDVIKKLLDFYEAKGKK
jgi:negative regulator of replication initiation